MRGSASIRAAAVVSLATLAGCVGPFARRARPGAGDPTGTVVQVRDYPGAATVAVLGWDAEEAAYGLRANVGYNGKISGGYVPGHHRLYLSTTLVHQMGGVARASVPTRAVLRTTGVLSDWNACNRTRTCSPMQVVTVSVPDEVLRQSQDSLVVSFVSYWGKPWDLTLHRELIDTYLHAVDSVAVTRRRR
jgi:hypothetical protein